jgi:hypothetical protein
MSDQPTFGGIRHEEQPQGQIVLRVHESAVRPHVAGAGATLSVELARRLPESVTEPLDFLRREVGARSMRPLFVPTRVRSRVASRATSRGGRSVSARDRNRIAVIASVAESESEELAG